MVSDRVTGDDSVFCRLCDPPHETSLAMIAVHLHEVHGYDPQLIADAPVLIEGEPAPPRERTEGTGS